MGRKTHAAGSGAASRKVKEDFLSERQRAEDILLGSLGFAEEASIISIERCETGYRGVGRYADGSQFEFQSDCEPDEIEEWALQILGVA